MIVVELPIFDIVFLSIVGLIELSLAGYFFFRYQRSAAIIAYSWFVFSVGVWVFLNGFALIFPRGGIVIDVLGRSIFVAAAFIFPFLYLFADNYPVPSRESGRRLWFFLLLSPMLLSLLIYFSKALIVGFDNSEYALTIYGQDFWIFVVYLLLMFFLALIEIVKKYRRSDGIHRVVMKFVLWGIVISGSIGLTNNLILPYYFHFNEITWLGSGASIIWLGLMARVLFKK